MTPGQSLSFKLTPNPGYAIASVDSNCGGTLTGDVYTIDPVAAPCSYVTANFTQGTPGVTYYNVTAGVLGGNGSISPPGVDVIASGATSTFTVTPYAGYTASVGGTCGGTLTGNSYKTNPITADCTVVASFTQTPPPSYTITASAGSNGAISPSGQVSATPGTSSAFTVTPAVGYSAAVSGTCGGVLNGNTFTTSPINADCTVTATFTLTASSSYTVTSSAGSNGTISPLGQEMTAAGTQRTFTVTPSSGYSAAVSGTCGGTLSGNIYTTNPVNADCTVVASFTSTTSYYTITASAGSNGAINPTGLVITAAGTARAFTVTPNAGYSATVGGTCGGTLSGNVYTTSPITASCTVVASFTPSTSAYYTVTVSAGSGGGTISPLGQTKVASGLSLDFTVTPNAGYKAVLGGTCGYVPLAVGSLNTSVFATKPVTADCTVTVTFTPITYAVTASAGAGAMITPSGQVPAAAGTSLTFTVRPSATNGAVVTGTCGGTFSGNTYTTNPITANCTVVAGVAPSSYTVTASAGAGAMITPSGQVTATYGTPLTFTVRPSATNGAVVVGTCGGAFSGNTYTTNPITANCTVTANAQ
ncbi:MAG: hypothetical protein LBH31_01950 [Burkholderiaceae bacterium]|nr:hypothetical protein [Burkholderiaceae bacterium]